MLARIKGITAKVAWYGFGSFMLVVYATLAIANGSFFRRETEKEKLDLAIGIFTAPI